MTDSVTTCSHCGAKLAGDFAFCQSCGKATGGGTTAEEPGTIGRLRAALADRYTIERELGRGGMATVYLAQDVRHERRVAIKVLLPELAASVGGDRFIREIRVAAKLQHPHILTLYDSGDADGQLYYVMPFVEGESLRDRLNREKMLPVDEALNLVVEIAEALGYAHAQGIVHRDIKPENILLSGGHALVADFGIARAISAAEQHKLTQTGTAVGTPVYMSPEQAMGEDVGPSADLYSLGCMAFELLTGQPPFTGASARAIMARHTVEAPPGIRTVRETVPEEVEEAILWTLAKVPADRPKTAAQFIEALSLPLAGTVTPRSAFRRMTTGPRITSVNRPVPVWRRPAVLVVGALLVLAAGVAAWKARSVSRVRTGDGPDPKSLAVLYFDDLSPKHDLGYLADGLTEGLISTLRDVRELHVLSRGGAEQFRGSSLAPDSIARALGVGTLVRGSVEPEGPDVRVTVRLLDGGSGTEFQRASFRRPASDPLALRDTLAVEVAGLVRQRLGEEIRLREQRAGTRLPDAWVLLQRAERLRRQMDSLTRAGDSLAAGRTWTEADTLLAQAEAMDHRWIEPITLRGTLAYLRSRAAVDDPGAAGRWIAVGLAHADRALALDDRDPDARELRGNLRYWKWLLQLERDPRAAHTLLVDAKADLELATVVRPSQAGAWASLSHLYNQTGSGVDVNLAARRAMEEDAYLSNADLILSRLFFSSYDLGQFPDARHWCDEGLRRFPGNARFTECRLILLTARTERPDPALAVRLADSLVAMLPAPQQAYGRLAANLWVAGVLARAERADSARQLTARSLGNAALDPTRDLANQAAFVYGLLGDTARALDQLKIYVTANPARRQALAEDPGWWFRGLAAHPGFRQLVGTATP